MLQPEESQFFSVRPYWKDIYNDSQRRKRLSFEMQPIVSSRRHGQRPGKYGGKRQESWSGVREAPVFNSGREVSCLVKRKRKQDREKLLSQVVGAIHPDT